MPDRARPSPEGSITAGGQVVLGERLAAFKRVYRWFNLTLVHQATWPLALLITAAPPGAPEAIPMPWYLLRLGAPLVAALGAMLYLTQRPVAANAPLIGEPIVPPASFLATQARFLLIGLPVMVLLVRLAAGPVEPVGKLALFGLADVAAFHLIHFGIVARSYAASDRGLVTAVMLFAVSWGMRDALLVTFGPDTASPSLAFLTGIVLGLVTALAARALYRWPGGILTAAAMHWLVFYLVFGFVE